MNRPFVPRFLLCLLLASLSGIYPPDSATACTRILWNTNKLAVVVGRTMDWPGSTEPMIAVFPRGLKRDGGRVGPFTVLPENALQWTSKYGSLVVTAFGVGTGDGINEKGLGAHLLYFTATDFGPRDPSKPGLQAGLWAQYLLDNAATVSEALALEEKFQLIMIEKNGHKATLHLAIEDASGDSAIIEYIDGKAVIHHGHDYRVMTNDPEYEQQLALLKQQDFSHPSRDILRSDDVSPIHRFQRASYYEAKLPEPKNEQEAVSDVLAITRSVSVPLSSDPSYKSLGTYNTEYRTVADLTNRRYLFELSTSSKAIWIDLSKFDLSPGAQVKLFDPNNNSLAGDVSGQFQAAQAPF
ncbi:MAG: linear amide C-N hydrolase [Verrucomicrobia bacterium]|nr:linear amide C-N hydrolase [Verrucomicrobiota bacterium]